MPTKSTVHHCNRAQSLRRFSFLVLAISSIAPTWAAELADSAVGKAVTEAAGGSPPDRTPKVRAASVEAVSAATVATTGSVRTSAKRVVRQQASVDDTTAPLVPGNLTRMQDEIDTLEKADQMAGRKLSIAGKRQQIRKITSVDDSQSRLRGDMKVVGIEGPVGSLTATIRFASGEEIEVRSGDHLPDGRKVRSITSTGVTLATRNTVTNFPMTGASGKAISARPDALPAERVLVPFGASLPPPQGINR